jgi:hypothetical protein
MEKIGVALRDELGKKFDNALLSMGESIGGVFCLSRDILHPKSGAGDAIGNGWWSIGRTF